MRNGLFWLSFVVLFYSSLAFCQEVCPDHKYEAQSQINNLENAIIDIENSWYSVTGLKNTDDVKLYCTDVLLHEQENYKSKESKNPIQKKEEVYTRGLLKKDEIAMLENKCFECFSKKLDTHFVKFFKKHGKHLPDTPAYRTEVRVVWGEAERIPTKAQAKYDLLFEEHRDKFDDSVAWAACYENDESCQKKKTAESELNQIRNEIKSLQKDIDDLPREKNLLDKHERSCASYKDRSDRYYDLVRQRDFLVSCKYSDNQQPVQKHPVQQQQQTKPNVAKVNDAINVGKGVRGVFGF